MLNDIKLKDEVKNLLDNNKNLNEKDFEIFFTMINSERNGNDVDKTTLCDTLVKKIFGSSYNNEILIPWVFFDTQIGQAIIKIKYGYENTEIYFVRDIASIMGKSRQYVSQEIQLGNLMAYKRDGKVIVYRQDLNNYLNKRGIEKNLYKEVEEKIIVPNDREEKYGK